MKFEIIRQTLNGKEVHDPYLNQAIAYYLVNEYETTENLFRFYSNEPTVILGKNQNARTEVDADYLEKENIHLSRRLSGGGAVYLDKGSLLYGFILNDAADEFLNFERFGNYIIKGLERMGVKNAETSGRNDLTINGKKFCGQSMAKTNSGKLVSGGTLIIDIDEKNTANKVLTPPDEKLRAHGVKSVGSRITGLREHFEPHYQKMTVDQLKEEIMKNVIEANRFDVADIHHLSDEEWERIRAIADEKFRNEKWILNREQ